MNNEQNNIDTTAEELYREALELRARFDEFEAKLNAAFNADKLTSLEFNRIACTAIYNHEMRF